MIKNYTNSSFDTIVNNGLSFILIVIILITLSGLTPATAQEVKEFDSFITEVESADQQKATRLKSLVYDVHPTVYINDGVFAPIGEGPMSVAQIDAGDLGKLQQGHDSLYSVNLLMIRFKSREELQAFRLQPATLGNMPNLAYVFLSLGFDTAQRESFLGIQGFDASQIVFLYESARPF